MDKKNIKEIIALITIFCLGIIFRLIIWMPLLNGQWPEYINRELMLNRQSLGAIPLLLGLPLEIYLRSGILATVAIPIIWFIVVRKNKWSPGWVGLIVLTFSGWLIQAAAAPLAVISMAVILLGWYLKKYWQLFMFTLGGLIFPLFWPGVIVSSYLLGWRKALVLIIAAAMVRFNELHFWYINKAYYTELGFISRINELRGYLLNDLGNDKISRLFSAVLFNKITWFFWTFSQRLFTGLDTYWWYGSSRHEMEITTRFLPRFNLGELAFLGFGLTELAKKDLIKSALIMFVICIPVAIPIIVQPSRDFLLFLPVYALLCDWGWNGLNSRYIKFLVGIVWIYMAMSHFLLLINFNQFHV